MVSSRIKLIILILAVTNNSVSLTFAPVVKTSLGKVKGITKVSFKNREYDAFTAIPYGKPPVGDLRFQAPEPVSAWKGIFDATKQEPVYCPQYSDRTQKAIGDENCLVLNVFRPHKKFNPFSLGKQKTLLPVIFYIHGGAFLIGSSGEYEPKYIMDKDVVFVSTNYRLNSLGFLSTGDELVSGNMGLKDQSLALKWTVDNIEHFGGDPKRITLLGCSAGGASVHHQFLSPLNKGRFQNGISMSGSALAPWAFSKYPLKDAKKLGTMLKCPTDSSVELVGCLRNASALDLATAGNQILESEYLTIGIDRPPFRPVAEKIKEGYFINDTPENIITGGKANDVPWIAGATSEEGIMFTFRFLLNQTSIKYIDKNWKEVGPYLMFMQEEESKKKRRKAVKAARKYYLKRKKLDVNDYDTLKNLIHLAGDKGIVYPAGKSATLQAKAHKSAVYLYHYNFRAEQGLGDVLLSGAKVDFGVCHCDDAELILKHPNADTPTRENDLIMQKALIDMIYSLATEGKPNIGVEWPRVDPTNEYIEYMHFGGPNDLIVNSTNNYGEMKFWDKYGFYDH